VSGCGNPGSAVDVGTDVALVGQKRRAGVKAHPHRKLERILRLARRGKRARCSWKRDEEGVALGVDLDPAVGLEGLAQHAPVLRELIGVALGSELVQQPRRALDVGEEEGDGATW
jgi:hypothetical protein